MTQLQIIVKLGSVFTMKISGQNGDKTIFLSDAYKWDFYDEYPTETKEHLFLALENQDLYFERLKILDNVKKTIKELVDSENQVILISATGKE